MSRLIAALDVGDLAALEAACGLLAPAVTSFKVGLELYTACGPAAVERVRRHAPSVFLDLKICDIPHTAAGAVRSAAGLGVELCTVHALGGPAMIGAAREAAEKGGGDGTRILAVTILTSLGDEELATLGVSGPAGEAVLRLGRMAVAAGAHGLVASPREAARLREALGPEVLLVIPGIRPAGAAVGDQRRTMTPAEAVAAGADRIVVGRPILGAVDPLAAARAILAEIGE